MIKSVFGLSKEPFNRNELTLLSQQKHIIDIIKIHSQQGGFSVVIGEPGLAKASYANTLNRLKKNAI